MNPWFSGCLIHYPCGKRAKVVNQFHQRLDVPQMFTLYTDPYTLLFEGGCSFVIIMNYLFWDGVYYHLLVYIPPQNTFLNKVQDRHAWLLKRAKSAFLRGFPRNDVSKGSSHSWLTSWHSSSCLSLHTKAKGKVEILWFNVCRGHWLAHEALGR